MSKVHEAYCLDSQQGQLLWYDDFLGRVLADEWYVYMSGGAGSAAVVDQQNGGIVRLTSHSDSGDYVVISWQDFRSLLVTKEVAIEVRMKMTSIAAIEAILYLFANWSNYIEFGYSAARYSRWYFDSANGGVSSPIFDSGITVTGNYTRLKIVCHTHGANHIHFLADDVECANSPITNAAHIPLGYLNPRIYVITREAATKSLDIDYVVVKQNR